MKSTFKIFLPSLAIVFAMTLLATDVIAQGGRGGGGRGGPGGRQGGQRGGGTSELGLITNEKIQDELELNDAQVEDLTALVEESRDRGRGFNREDFEGLERDEIMAKITEMRESRSKEQKEKLEEILLPHQMKRLTQLVAQMSAQNGIRGGLAETLGLSDEQIEELKVGGEELQKKLIEEFTKRKQELQQELISDVLTVEQQAQYKEIMGEPFAFEQRGAGFGGAGGRGGAQGGGRGGAQGGGRGGAQGGGDRGGRGGGDRGGRGGRGGGDRGGDRGGDANRDDA